MRKKYILRYFAAAITVFFLSNSYAAEVTLKNNGNTNKTFYIPTEGYYFVSATLRPKRIFIPDEVVNISMVYERYANISAISNWGISSNLTNTINEDGLTVCVPLDKQSNTKNSVILTKEFFDINLKEHQFISLFYKVENPGIQNISVDVWFKNNNDKKFSKKINLVLEPTAQVYFINLYEKAIKFFGKKYFDNLYLNKINIVYQKKENINIIEYRKKDVYKFTLKNFEFLKYEPIVIYFGDSLSEYQPTKYYYYDKEKGERNAESFDEIPYYVKNIYRLKIKENIDLNDSPILTFSFSKPNLPIGIKELDKPMRFKFILNIDFDGDENGDVKTEMYLAAVLKNSGLFINAPVLEKIKKMFPNKKHYNLLELSISQLNDGVDVYQKVITKKFFRYKEKIYNLSDFEISSHVLTIDDKIYTLPPDYNGSRKDNRIVLEFNKIKFKEGNHSISFADNEKFIVNMVEIKPASDERLIVSGQDSPEIEFKKINPTRYVVTAKDAKKPFTLVFNESFNNSWKAYIRQSTHNGQYYFVTDKDESFSALWSVLKEQGKRVELKEHFMVNGYANAWIVPLNKTRDNIVQKNFQIVLEYTPQRLFEVGIIISGITLLSCAGYLIIKK